MSPSQSLGNTFDGTIDFDAQNAIWRMNLGYMDFMKHKEDILSFLKQVEISTKIPDHIRKKIKKMV